ALRITRKWVDAGRLDYAAETINRALTASPAQPEFWRMAAQIARLNRQPAQAVENARQAASLRPGDPDYILFWASEALLADQPDEAGRALATLPVEIAAESAFAHRMSGELARRRHQLTAARNHFEAAIRLDGSVAIDEVPLGLILLNSSQPNDRRRGTALLVRWSGDSQWGATALRTLLAEARRQDDRPAQRQWAAALLRHPAVTLADMPEGLAALARADETLYASVLAELEKNHSVSPDAAAQLMGWLNQIGRSADAVAWMKTLPAAGVHRPPLVVAGAEALRQTGDWTALQDWTREGSWGTDVDFLRWTYGLEAARHLGDTAGADEFWRTLRSHSLLHSTHALFAASSLYSWGRISEAETLLWLVADQSNDLAVQALGTLARHYQVRRDADGQYRAFRRLHLLQPRDADISNNYAFFAALTDHEQRAAADIARENLQADPRNLTYLATRAFVLFMAKRTEEALAVLQPNAAAAAKSPGFAFAYGLALAGTGQRGAARLLLAALPPETLTIREEDLIRTTLGD
ncbi:MAG: hypothetical protein ACHQ5A_08360, partial [Opitutales bacterium]